MIEIMMNFMNEPLTFAMLYKISAIDIGVCGALFIGMMIYDKWKKARN